jgi:biotin carboxyl carrier protein
LELEMRATFLRPLGWIITLAVLAGLLAGAYLLQDMVRRRQAESAAEPEAPRRAANAVVKLGAKLAESFGIKDEPALDITWTKRVPAYGRVVPNPRATAELRAAFAGTLRAGSDGATLTLGSWIKAGETLGWLDVRVGPQERLDLLTRLNEARFKQQGAEELVRLQQARVDRYQGAGAGVSRAELDSALRDVSEARTMLATAKAAVKEWQDALDAIDRQGDRKDKRWSQPLTAPAAGEVTELGARPGTAVEPGALVARLVDFRHALVRLEMPPEVAAFAPPAEVELFAPAPAAPALEGASNRPEPASPARSHRGRLLGATPQVEVNSQFAAFWYEVDTSPGKSDSRNPKSETKREGLVSDAGSGVTDWPRWRPGLFIKALVEVPDVRPREAVSVPATSLLYHQGRALVYVRLSPGRFERREVQVLGREQDRWVLAAGVEAGEQVVSQRAQVLLSEEFRGEADID